MKRSFVFILMLLILLMSRPVYAQDSVFPLPAPLYLLTSEHQILRVEPQTGEQTIVSPEGQRVLDFDIAPDGEWYAYRTEDGMVIISAMKSNSGYVVEFLERMPSPRMQTMSGVQTIAWNRDDSALAYIVPDGVRIAELGAGEYGTPIISAVQGPWVELYWFNYLTLIASDAAGEMWAISGTDGAWTVEQVEADSVWPQPEVLSTLTAEGITLDNKTLIPRTAGALAYAWGPLPLPVVDGLQLHTDLYFLSADAQGIAQVWQLPRNGDPVRMLTTENAGVTAYAVAPTGRQMAYVVADELFVVDLYGTSWQVVATLQTGDFPPSVAWSHRDSTQLAFHDGRGIWIVPADGSQPQRLVIGHHLPATQADAINVRFYSHPRWSYDNTRLLVTIGLWEGSVLGVVDAATGSVTELPGVMADDALWTLDGRVIAWASAWGYSIPGLFLLDPHQPDAAPFPLLESGTPVLDVYLDAYGEKWHALVTAAAEMGPQYVRRVSSRGFDETLEVPDNSWGGFVRQPRVNPYDEWVVGLRDVIYTDTGKALGVLVMLNMGTGYLVQIRTNGPVWDVTWG